MNERPAIALTLGDPAGVGPEIVLKSLADSEIALLARWIAVGIPIIRTSVDHGTAFDIAGRNVADPRSMKQAMRVALRMASA